MEIEAVVTEAVTVDAEMETAVTTIEVVDTIGERVG